MVSYELSYGHEEDKTTLHWIDKTDVKRGQYVY